MPAGGAVVQLKAMKPHKSPYTVLFYVVVITCTVGLSVRVWSVNRHPWHGDFKERFREAQRQASVDFNCPVEEVSVGAFLEGGRILYSLEGCGKVAEYQCMSAYDLDGGPLLRRIRSHAEKLWKGVPCEGHVVGPSTPPRPPSGPARRRK